MKGVQSTMCHMPSLPYTWPGLQKLQHRQGLDSASQIYSFHIATRSVQVRSLLESLPQEKWVFTNCNEKHARSALQLLGIAVS